MERNKVNPCGETIPPNQKQKDSSSSITCRSSASHVAAVMAKFDERKKQIVRGIGFGGLLELGQINRVNRRLSLWLLSNTSWENGIFDFGDNQKVQILSNDIENIIGIPSNGIDVMSNKLKEDDKTKFFNDHLLFLGDEMNALRNAGSIVQKQLPDVISKKDSDEFKIAFVVFIMGRFLAPTSDFYIGNSDFWHVLVKPDELHSYNWSAYVLHHILDAARLIKFANILNKSVNAINGCPLLLQIFYLDNIDLGTMNMPHDNFPRIKDFDCTILGKMIQADISNGTEHKPGTHSCSKMRCRSESCYSLVDASSLNSQTTTTSKTRLSPYQKKRAFISMAAGSSPSLPPKTTSGIPDLPAYIRSKYAEHLELPFIDALRYHNAKCIQHVNKSKNALLTSIVNENIYLADKYIQHHLKATASGIPKYPKKNSFDNRRTYDDLLSGPESGSDAEDHSNRRQLRKSSPNAPAILKDQPSNDMGRSASAADPMHLMGPTILLSARKNHESNKMNSNEHAGHAQNDQEKNADDSINKTMPSTPKTPSVIGSSTPQTPIGSSTPQTPFFSSDSSYNTPDPISKMPPLSPELSPTSNNKLHSDLELSTRMLTSSIILDLNSRTIDAEYNISPIQKKTVRFGRYARSHWTFGCDHPDRDSSVTVSLFEWLSSTNSEELERSWIRHDIPRFIERKGIDFKNEFVGEFGLSYELFDVSVRRLKQLDSLIYPSDIPLRWRHFLESDFAMHSLAEENPADSFSIREQFIGKAVDYELSCCRMLFIPVLTRGGWWCYAIDMRDHSVYILDPSVGTAPQDIVITLHLGTITAILESLKATLTRLFEGWVPSFDDFDKIVIRMTTNTCKRCDSGFYTLYCMKNFNGGSMVVSESEVTKFKHYLLYELFELKQNKGIRPSVYVQTIDD